MKYILIDGDSVYIERNIKKLESKARIGLEGVEPNRYNNALVYILDDVKVRNILVDKYIIQKTLMDRLFKRDIAWYDIINIVTLVLVLFLFIIIAS